MGLILAAANIEDAEALKEMSVASFQQGFELYGRYPPGIESLDWHKSEIKLGHYYTVLSDNELVGGICVTPIDSQKVFLKYLFISVHRQDKGMGSAVLKLIETQYSWAKQWTLLTPYKSYRNQYLYEKHGYLKVGEVQPDPDDEFKAFEYLKELSS